jgi:hypothetical protein
VDLAFDSGGTFAYVLVFLAAATPVIEVLVVIPGAIAAGLAPVPVALVALAGNLTTVALCVVAGDRIVRAVRTRRASRSGGPEAQERGPGATGRGGGRSGRARRILDRYGVPGLALIGPVLTGSHVAALAALGFGAPRGRVMIWMAIGLVVWAVPVTVAAAVGFGALS